MKTLDGAEFILGMTLWRVSGCTVEAVKTSPDIYAIIGDRLAYVHSPDYGFFVEGLYASRDVANRVARKKDFNSSMSRQSAIDKSLEVKDKGYWGQGYAQAVIDIFGLTVEDFS